LEELDREEKILKQYIEKRQAMVELMMASNGLEEGIANGNFFIEDSGVIIEQQQKIIDNLNYQLKNDATKIIEENIKIFTTAQKETTKALENINKNLIKPYDENFLSEQVNKAVTNVVDESLKVTNILYEGNYNQFIEEINGLLGQSLLIIYEMNMKFFEPYILNNINPTIFSANCGTVI
jgi:hypothetical protein